MSEKVEVTLDKELYDRLTELQVPPYNDVNAVIGRLLHHSGRKSREAVAIESEGRRRSYAEEIQANSDGVYASSGISP